jgi:FkbM family methyltransferase
LGPIHQHAFAALLHCYPLYSGCGSIANLRILRKLAPGGGGGDETGGGGREVLAWARLRCGERLLVPLNDYVGRAAFFTGDLDRKISWVCSRLVRPGDTVLDIGANLGVVTMHLASLVGSAGRVHAFEPNPRMVDLLRQSLAQRAVQNVALHAVGLGAEDAELELHVPADHAGQASLRANPMRERVNVIRVPVKTLATIDRLPRDVPMRLVKIDVEGYEPEVLRGAEPLLANNPPQAILFEANHCKDFRSHPTVQVLARHGYDFFALPKRWVRMSAVRVNGASQVPGHDFVAIQRGPNHDWMTRALRAA